ncbi:MAG: tetratricopeptide repeat protein [Bacteroidota bacterium]
MRKLNLIIVLLFISTFLAANETQIKAEECLKIGNELYQKENYVEAIVKYESALNQGYESADLYFNLGNSYFKNNDITNAIYNYEKAKKLSPSDEDINFNLELSNTKILDKIDKLPEIFYKRWWNIFANIFSEKTWSILILLSLVVFFSLVVIYLFSKTYSYKKNSFFAAIFAVLVIILFSFAASYEYIGINNKSEAIIFSYTVNVKASPDINSKEIFVIHEGTKVRISDNIGDWYEIKIPNGSKGWINKSDLKII